jgi:hypothetical protein
MESRKDCLLSHTKCFWSRFAKVDSHPSINLLFDMRNSKGYIDGFVGELTSAKRLWKHFVWDNLVGQVDVESHQRLAQLIRVDRVDGVLRYDSAALRPTSTLR